MAISQIVVSNDNITVSPIEENSVFIIGTSGPQGPMGPEGPSQVVSYVHIQSLPSSIWTIEHNLDFIPNITVVDTAGSVVEGDYSYPDENTVIATFSGGFAGKAYLS